MLNGYDDCFKCHCCQGLPDGGIDPKLVDLLNDADISANDINCAYRCPEHNAEVGGVPNSQHVDGTAADVDASNYGSVELLAQLFENLEADGVGRYFNDGFVHVDVRSGRIGEKFRW